MSEKLQNSDQQSAGYSFYTEDSYELLQANPDISMQRFRRPDHVPKLCLDDLPDYVSSSDEDLGEGEDPQEE